MYDFLLKKQKKLQISHEPCVLYLHEENPCAQSYQNHSILLAGIRKLLQSWYFVEQSATRINQENFRDRIISDEMDFAIVKNNIWAYSTVFAFIGYCYFVSSRIRKGFFRLISLLPLFFYLAVTLHLPPVLVAAGSLILLISLVNFAAFEQGQQSSSGIQPLKKSFNFSYVAMEFIVSSVLIWVLLCYKDKFYPKILIAIYGCLVLLGVDCLGTVSNLILHFTVGLELESPSDKPYLSTSLQDFWGKRWNLAVTKNLWRTVYNPMKSTSAAAVQGNKLLASFAAVTITFLVSGLFHELLLYFLTGGAKPTWEMTSFFLLHGICVAMEVAMKKVSNSRRRTELPRWVSGPVTIGFVTLTSFWLFFPPLIRSGADTMVIQQLRTFADFVGIECLPKIQISETAKSEL